MVIMSYRTLILFAMVLLMGLIMASGAYAYQGFSGYNEYYYTDYYKPTVYYPTPYYAPNYASVTYVGNYATPYYYNTPVTYYNSAYYPAYGYGPRVITYAPAYYTYPTAYRAMTFYKNDSGWGFSIGGGAVCGIYGYC